MNQRAALVAVGLLAAASATSALALDYRSVIEPALLYDAPSQQARPLFAIARGTPVEAVVTLDAWVKVRDAKGDLAWIERRLLADRRTLLVKADTAQVRAQAEDAAPMVFEAEKGVLLELLEPGPAGWLKIRHRDGQQGYVKTLQVWGF